MSENQTWHCAVCNEDHPLIPTVQACGVRDQLRISNLEVAVESLKTKVMEARPAPPGVLPPMGGPLVPSEGQCAYPIGGGVLCLLPPGHDGAHGMTWASPAEAASPEQGCAHDVREFINVAGRHVFQCIRCGRAGAVPDAAIFERGGHTPQATTAHDGLAEALERARLARQIFDHLPLESKVVAVEAGWANWQEMEAREEHECKAPSPREAERITPPPSTPAAMLGDAVELARRAKDLLDAALKDMPAKDTTGARHLVTLAAGDASNAASWAEQAREEMERAAEVGESKR